MLSSGGAQEEEVVPDYPEIGEERQKKAGKFSWKKYHERKKQQEGIDVPD